MGQRGVGLIPQIDKQPCIITVSELRGNDMHGHKAKTGNAKVKKVGNTTAPRYGQNVSAKQRGGSGGSDLSYGK